MHEVEQGNLSAGLIRKDLPISHAENQLAREQVLGVFICPSDVSTRQFHLGGGSTDHAGHGHDHAHEEEHSIDDRSPLFLVSKSNYVGVFGSLEIEDAPSAGDGVFFHNSKISFDHIRDGLSNTLIVGERMSRYGGSLWQGVVPGAAEAMARVVGVTDHSPNDAHHHFEDFSSLHPSGAHFLIGDGSVRILNNEIDLSLYRALSTRSGGEAAALP
jgi:hypothetical protein